MRQWLAHHEDLSQGDQFMRHDAAYLVAAMKGAPAPLILGTKIVKQTIELILTLEKSWNFLL